MTSDPFAILGAERRFAVDEDELRRAYLRRAARLHPDRFTDAGEQAEAAREASEVNAAYQTLRDPERRARALLGLTETAGEDDSAALPPDLLMEVMEVRERLEEAEAAGDTGALSELRSWAETRHADALTAFADAFDANDLVAARQQINVMRYASRMLEQMTAK